MEAVKRIWVGDLEQFPNFHCATFIDRDSDEVRVFVLHKSRNDLKAYYEFLTQEVAGMIGYNIVNYDYPIWHLLIGMGSFAQFDDNIEGIIQILYEESRRIINSEYSAIPHKDEKFPLLDVFRIHHFNNKAKATSLKAVEIAIRFHNVQDIPFDEYHHVTAEEVNDILTYNYNDSEATKEFYFLTTDKVELRKKLGKIYRLNLINYNDPKIGEEIFGREIARKKNINYKYLRDMRTYRRYINLGECLIDYIEFKTNEFKWIHQFFKKTTIESTYKPFEESIIYKGLKYNYGAGGLHACVEPGVYESDGEYALIDIDVASYYPSLAIQNGFYPQHLGEAFVTVYKELFDTRMEAKKAKDQPVVSGLKLALNGVYGKSNDQYSLFYDPKYTMRITINGQLLLSMLAEALTDIHNLQMIQVNTDGMTVKVPRIYEEIVDMTCRDWEKKTGLILEKNHYKKIVIRDVNNYLAIKEDGDVKPIGCFEIIPMQNGEVAYNKDWSMRVVPKAIHAYYIEGIPIEEFIPNHTDIYDFCLGFRARQPWDIYASGLAVDVKYHEKQQRTIRYYMSKGGSYLTKENREDRRVISLESKKTVEIFNRFEKKRWEDYHIDYNYYIAEANKIKNAVDDGQLKLF